MTVGQRQEALARRPPLSVERYGAVIVWARLFLLLLLLLGQVLEEGDAAVLLPHLLGVGGRVVHDPGLIPAHVQYRPVCR